ncbi:DNA-binding protein [Mixta sp. BE291]|uniref:helix-turn-helix transcriptional regulator n=1 Tax=Mixta sp. BE291 TaxID=3158787 RepID=UPI00332E02FB
MMIYHFTLTLADVNAHTPGLEDALFECGCDDALLCFYGNTVYLEFDRESSCFEHALLSAIADIESSTLSVRVASVDATLLGLSDIAQRSQLSRQAIAMLKDGTRGPGSFPAPVQRLTGSSPLWRWASVARWLHENGKLSAEMAENAQIMENINLALALRATPQRQYVTQLAQRLAERAGPCDVS